jgi:hypothetical protein
MIATRRRVASLAAVVAVVGGGSVLAAGLRESESFKPLAASPQGGLASAVPESPSPPGTVLLAESGLVVTRGEGRTADEVCIHIEAVGGLGGGAVGCDSRLVVAREGATFALQGQGNTVFHILIPPTRELGAVRANGTSTGKRGVSALIVTAPRGDDVRFEGTGWDRVSQSPR